MSRIVDWLRIARAPLAATAAFDAIACALLARGPGLSTGAASAAPADLAILGATSLLIFFAGMIGNDWADRRVDRATHPERPIPSGRIRPVTAGVIALLCAVGALTIGGGAAGSREAVALAIVSAASYDLFAKRSSVLGPLAMFLVRSANAAVGVVPLLVAGTASPLAIAAPLLIGAYSAGVTALSQAEDSPGASSRRLYVARAASFAAFAGAGLLSMVGAQTLTFGALFAASVCVSVACGRTPRTSIVPKAAPDEPRSERTRLPLPVRAQVLELLLGLYWLEAVLAGGARPGSDGWFTLGTFGVAFAAIVGSQLAIRALRRRA